jgi:hypothetical protein
VLDAYNVQFLVLNLYSESDVVKFFRLHPGWKVDFEDEEAIIFARAGGSQVCDRQTEMDEGVQR